MKLQVVKLPHGAIRIDLTFDTAKKPVTVTIESYQLPMVQQMLEAARKADKFTFELEL